MALDSIPVFEAKLKELGLDCYLESHFTPRGWTAAANFAFAANYVPGTPDDSTFVADVILPVLGSTLDPQVPALRRLFFDCYTMLAADAQRKA
eukprot:9110294-Karenia_brevis.AAC.1